MNFVGKRDKREKESITDFYQEQSAKTGVLQNMQLF